MAGKAGRDAVFERFRICGRGNENKRQGTYYFSHRITWLFVIPGR
jgi:hypothetical protein